MQGWGTGMDHTSTSQPGRRCQEESWGRGGLGLLDSQPSWAPGTLKNPISKHKLKTQESFSVLTTDSTRTRTDMHMHAHTCAHPHISIYAHTKEIWTYDKGSFASETFPYETRGNQMNIFIWPSRPRAAVIYAVSRYPRCIHWLKLWKVSCIF